MYRERTHFYSAQVLNTILQKTTVCLCKITQTEQILPKFCNSG